MQREVAETADPGSPRIAHPRPRAVEPALHRARVDERRAHARQPAEQPLLQHGAQPPQRGQLAQEQRGEPRRPRALDLARHRPRVGGAQRQRLLHQQRPPGPRRLRAQRGPLIGRRADHDRMRAADRRLGPRHRHVRDRPGHRVLVPRGDESQVGLGGDHAQHVGNMRVAAAQQRNVDRHAYKPCSPAIAAATAGRGGSGRRIRTTGRRQPSIGTYATPGPRRGGGRGDPEDAGAGGDERECGGRAWSCGGAGPARCPARAASRASAS